MRDLARAIAAYTEAHPGSPFWETAIAGLLLLRSDHEKPPNPIISASALRRRAGREMDQLWRRAPYLPRREALVVTIEMPSVGRVFEASPDAPFLAAVVEFSPVVLRDVLKQLTLPPATKNEPGRGGATVIKMDPPITDCVLRMVQLLDRPEAIPILAPLLIRELSYWLLVGPMGGRIVGMTLGHDRWDQITRTIGRLREQFTEPLRIVDLAAEAGLSPSAFHRQFKAVTSMTPIQYQKQLRLLEARRMILTQRTKVESAAYATGYESPSQFSREYARMFGRSPKQDANTGTVELGNGVAKHEAK